MANYTLTYPDGADYYIQQLQTKLYSYLLNRWSIEDETLYKSFGRVYRVKSDDGYLPQAYNSTSTDYISSGGAGDGGLFFEDKLAALSYFYQVDPMKKNEERDDVAKYDLMFFVRLDRITPGGYTNQAGQRMDEIAINDVKNFVQNNGCACTVHETIREVDKVLEKFSGEIKRITLNRNMQPFFCFKLQLELRYMPTLFTTPQQKQLQPMQKSLVLYIRTTPDTSNVIDVGDGLELYAEYAPTNNLKPLLNNGSTTGYLAGKNIQLPFVYNESNVSLPDFNLSSGVWTRTGDPTGFVDGDYVTINFTDQV